MLTLYTRTDKKKRKFAYFSNENEKTKHFVHKKNETLTSLDTRLGIKPAPNWKDVANFRHAPLYTPPPPPSPLPPRIQLQTRPGYKIDAKFCQKVAKTYEFLQNLG
jgi:hypothetical protein